MSPRIRRRRRLRGDGGSIQVLFGILMASGMLLAMFAVVVDGGRLDAEYEELRSASDAAALAVARACAETGGCDPVAAANGVAGHLANANAKDGAANVSRICGRAPGLTECVAPARTNLAACNGSSPATGSYVEVSTSTKLPDGATVFPPVVAGTVFGSYRGTTVGSCARVAWGAPTRLDRVFPIMISVCAWRNATANGTQYSAAPSASWDPAASEEDQISGASAACKGDPSSAQGDFAALIGPADVTCHQSMRTGDVVTGFPAYNILGGLVTGFCQGKTFLDWLIQVLNVIFSDGRPHVIYLPVYDRVESTGSLLGSYRYHIAGFAAFEPTGAVFGLLILLPSWRTGRLCGLQVPCLRGFFTRKAYPGRVSPGAEDYGVYATQLVG